MNKTRLLSVILTLALLIGAFPVTASATDYAPGDGETMDISACVGGDVITIGAGRSVTLTGSSVTLMNVRIICGANVNLTLQDVVISNIVFAGVCPLTFTGSDSTLVISGTVTFTGGSSAPGISIEDTAELTVEKQRYAENDWRVQMRRPAVPGGRDTDGIGRRVRSMRRGAQAFMPLVVRA